MTDLIRIKTFANMGWFKRKNDCLAYNRYRCQFFDVCTSRDHEYISKMLKVPDEPIAVDPEDAWKPWVSVSLDLKAA